MQSRREFLLAGLGLGIAALLRPGAAFAGTADAPVFNAGAGRADIVFSADLYPLDGFAGERDPLSVRLLLLDDGGRRMSIIVVDLTSISDDMIAALKTILADVAGVAAENALVCASHTFSTPHIFSAGQAPAGTDLARNGAALRAIEAALRTAAAQAVANLQPARLGFGSGTSRVNVNRDVPTPHGWWLGANDAGFADPFLGVLRIDGLDGKPLAILMNFAVQSSVMDGSQRSAGGRLISADLAGAAARCVEAHYGSGAVALFLVGAAGDQAPYLQANRHVVNSDGGVGQIDLHEAGFILVDLLGERLGADVVRVARNIATQPGGELEMRRESIAVDSQSFTPEDKPVGPVTAFNYKIGAKRTLPVILMRIGGMVLVGVQPELSASIGAQIRAASPYPQIMVATMVDGAAKYMPDAQSYDRFTYEARNSPYAKGAAEAAATAIADKLKRMKDSNNQGE
ncbi:hypothetical protein HC231_15570 [Brenneria izadpanahii]|uniref:Neutral/alkaline non-lysosomal ceramidase N-terminal domain-containing protein n=1 Tax=Brenneria izadpanahii TaxID=2722756 RepID=A0ABX7UTT6_9GAMM|nr:hypothetical protein [Brenneria izadpanahii]QTF09158.1 hypothetical protein HC231_15570 [Brenneria izadpanahii]